MTARKQKPHKLSSCEGPLLERVRRATANVRGISEKPMFGGVAILLHGNMCCGVMKTGEDLMVRVGPEAHADALAKKHARTMDVTGRPMKGFVFVDPAGTRTQKQVATWVERGLAFARTLPRK